jgi:hypothetical protein
MLLIGILNSREPDAKSHPRRPEPISALALVAKRRKKANARVNMMVRCTGTR